MESESLHALPNPPIHEPPKTVDGGTSRKRAIEDSTKKPPLAPKNKKCSPYWDHCEKRVEKLKNGSEQITGICNYCKVEIPCLGGNTSGLINHLVKRCTLSPLYENHGREKGQTLLTNETMGQGSQLVAHNFNQKRCEMKVTEYVIIDEVSFRAVEGRGDLFLSCTN